MRSTIIMTVLCPCLVAATASAEITAVLELIDENPPFFAEPPEFEVR